MFNNSISSGSSVLLELWTPMGSIAWSALL